MKLDDEEEEKDAKKAKRKVWTLEETEIIKKVIKNYYPNSVPTSVIEDLSKKFNRSFYSV